MSPFPTLDAFLGSGGSGAGKLDVPAGTLTAGQTKAVGVNGPSKAVVALDVIDPATVLLKPAANPTSTNSVPVFDVDGTLLGWQPNYGSVALDATGATAGQVAVYDTASGKFLPATRSFAGLNVTAIKTAAYVAVAQDYVRVNSLSATVPVTLPTSPTQGMRVVVQRTDTGYDTASITNLYASDGTTLLYQLQPGQIIDCYYDGTKWVLVQPDYPTNVFTPPMTNADDTFSPSFRKNPAHIRQPYRTGLAYWTATTDFRTGPTTNIVETTESDPYTPGGATPRFEVTSVSGGSTSFTRAYWLASPVDLSDAIIRFVHKVGWITGSRTGWQNLKLQFSSDRFATANYHEMSLNPAQIPVDFYLPSGGGTKTALTAVGAGADLTAVNAVRLSAAVNQSMKFYWSPVSLDFIPNTSTKGKMILRADDGFADHVKTLLPLLRQYGWAAALAPNIGQTDGITPESLRRAQQVFGAQVMTHSYSNSEHNSTAVGAGGPQLKSVLLKARFAQATYGLTGGDHFGWWGGLSANLSNYRTIKQFFVSGQYNTSATAGTGQVQVETLPPVDPHLMNCWLFGAGDTVAQLTTYAQNIAAQKGVGCLIFHNTGPTFPAVIAGFLAVLDGMRDVIDVVTTEEALRPWMSSSPLPASPFAVPGVPTLTGTQGAGTANLSWTRPASNGAPITRYAVYRSTTSGANFALLATVDATNGTEPMYTDTTVTAGTAYYYKVAARNAAGDSATSPQASVAAVANPTRPSTPTAVALPAGWWRAEDITGVANGAAVTTIPDASGNSLPMTTGGSPTLLTGALNGKPAVRHVTGGANQYARANGVPITADNATVIVVGRSSAVVRQTWAGSMATGGNSTNTNCFDLTSQADGTPQCGPSRTTSNQASAPYPLPPSTWGVVAGSIDTAANGHVTKTSVNGQVQTITPGTYTAATAPGAFGVGGALQSDTNRGGTAFADLDWCEALVFTTALSDADRKVWVKYLATTYGLPVYAY